MSDSRGRGARPTGQLSAEELLEMAEEIEEHARDLLTQARRLQRMAERMAGGGGRSQRPQTGGRSRTTPRPEEEAGGRARTGGRSSEQSGPRTRSTTRSGDKTRGRDTGSDRPAGEKPKSSGRRGDTAPSWAPPPRKRRS